MKTTDGISAWALRSLRLLLLISSPFASAQAASPGPAGATPPANFKVHNTVLGKVPLLGDPRSIVDSDDGQHIAFVVRRGLKSAVWHDGTEGPIYQRISRLMFSPAGAHLAYIASKSTDSEVVVLDGKELATHWSISTNSLQFSPNGNRIAYVFAAPTNRAVTTPPVTGLVDGQPHRFGAIVPLSVMVDGQPGREYPGIDTRALVFSPDSQHLAYVASLAAAGNQTVSLYCVVRDGVESEPCERVLETVFSPDSSHFAYGARQNGKERIVFDGKPGRDYDLIASDSLAFSPDSESLVYRAKRDGKRFLVVAGEETTPAGADNFGDPVFSPDSQRKAINVTRAGKERWLIDNQAGPEYDGVGRLSFSPDSRRTAYTGRRDDRWYLVLDGVESRAYEAIDDCVRFSPDSRHLWWLAKRQGKYRLLRDLDEQEPEYDWAGHALAISPDSRHVAFTAARGPMDASVHGLIVVDGREGPAYGPINKLAFDGNRTVHAVAERMNPDTFEHEFVRIELLITEDSNSLGEPR